MTDSVTDLLQAEDFRTGLLLGLLAAAVIIVARASQGRVIPWAGVALVAAVLLGLGSDLVPNSLVLALVMLAAGGYLSRDAHPVVRVLAAVPGAALIAADVDGGSIDWLPVAALLGATLGAALVADLDEVAAPSGLVPVMIAMTALGIYFCAPETQQSVVLVGVALPIALLGWPVPMASLGLPGAYVTAGLVAWVAVVGGSARPGAVVGGMACFGVLVVEPAVAGLLGRHAVAQARGLTVRTLTLAAIHGSVVGVSSRVAGLRESASAALGIVALTFAAAALAIAGVALLAGLRGRRR